MSVPVREVPASLRRDTSSPILEIRPVTRRRGATLLLVGAFVAQLTMLTLPLAAPTPVDAASIIVTATATPQTITLVSGGGTYAAGAADPDVTYSVTGGAS